MTDTEAIALRANRATQRHVASPHVVDHASDAPRTHDCYDWRCRCTGCDEFAWECKKVDYCAELDGAWPCDAASLAADIRELLARVRALEGALRRIDALPTGHLRRNGCASPRPWTDQRQVHQIARSVLGDTKG